jgi:hypothetical protein
MIGSMLQHTANMNGIELRNFLIIAKTYPELSSKYGETVCTAAVDELGSLYRLYPIPFRYLAGDQRFRRYQWITATVRKSGKDLRPESYSVEASSLVLGQVVSADRDEWRRREDIVFKNPSSQFSKMSELQDAQRTKGVSLALIYPSRIVSVTIKKRDKEDEGSFLEKLKALKASNEAKASQLQLFEESVPIEMRKLEYLAERICVEWVCADRDCAGHGMQILDWEICELARREGSEAARLKVETILDLNTHRSAFVLGNFHMFQQSFAIIVLWYPKKQPSLFRP